MKHFSAVFPLVIFFSMQISGQATTASEASKGAKISMDDFTGSWHGEEKCQNISAPVAEVTITTNGDSEVKITGLYSSVGPVLGSIKNNVITIPKQKVPDPIFNNLKIEGSLTLSKNRKSLAGIFIIYNNDARDDCGANYHR
jgi:hypothetical protein